jgi:hypothetical protein
VEKSINPGWWRKWFKKNFKKKRRLIIKKIE